MSFSKKIITALLLSATILEACNHEEKKAQPEQNVVTAPPADPIPSTSSSDEMSQPEANLPEKDPYVDSMMSMEVTLPPILDEKAYDTATVNSFTRLADISKGEMKLLANAGLLEQNISAILRKNNTDYADILFLIDVTGSMSDDIAAVKEGMDHIINVLKYKKDVRIAIATYRDLQNDSTNWFSFQDFETDYCAAQKFVDSIHVGSGGDLPESVYEAFIEAAKQKFWRSPTKRVVLIVGDARGKSKAEGGKYDMEDMLRKAGESRIKVNFFPLIITPYSEKYRHYDDNPQPATETHIIEQIFPNPTNGEIHMKLSQEGRYRVAVYSMTGLMVEDQYIDDNEWLIDMRIHDDGLYVICVTDKNNQFDVGKFILKR